MAEKVIRVLLLEPGKFAREAEIDASLAGMQSVVGGHIEAIFPFGEQSHMRLSFTKMEGKKKV